MPSEFGVSVDVCFYIESLIRHLWDGEEFTGSIIDFRKDVGVESVEIHGVFSQLLIQYMKKVPVGRLVDTSPTGTMMLYIKHRQNMIQPCYGSC